QVRHVEGASYLVERAALSGAATELTLHPQRWLQPEAIHRTSADGSSEVRVYGIDPDANCGLKNGDQILSINGRSVSDEPALQELADDWRKASELVVRLLRSGRIQTLHYQVVEHLSDL